ncbi:PREDICTED: uncharacterized protein LOC108527921 [Rhinopithecus bieti]|uniref:uncharacterized protein LOC108527921 n=1 Tax=Rhinopithecus bieti TaxID=61621 RepID=UPI00083BFAF8|nr:PREDICTED: uncharacterized protein LOC108527921 [Rhinopithecus bieti]
MNADGYHQLLPVCLQLSPIGKINESQLQEATTIKKKGESAGITPIQTRLRKFSRARQPLWKLCKDWRNACSCANKPQNKTRDTVFGLDFVQPGVTVPVKSHSRILVPGSSLGPARAECSVLRTTKLGHPHMVGLDKYRNLTKDAILSSAWGSPSGNGSRWCWAWAKREMGEDGSFLSFVPNLPTSYCCLTQNSHEKPNFLH